MTTNVYTISPASISTESRNSPPGASSTEASRKFEPRTVPNPSREHAHNGTTYNAPVKRCRKVQAFFIALIWRGYSAIPGNLKSKSKLKDRRYFVSIGSGSPLGCLWNECIYACIYGVSVSWTGLRLPTYLLRRARRGKFWLMG